MRPEVSGLSRPLTERPHIGMRVGWPEMTAQIRDKRFWCLESEGEFTDIPYTCCQPSRIYAHSIVPVCPVRSLLPLSISSDVPKSDIIALGLHTHQWIHTSDEATPA
jgi:hypothetical protein